MITQYFIHICDICGDSHLENVGAADPQVPSMRSSIPLGWTRLYNVSICDRHEVSVVVDDKREVVHSVSNAHVVNESLRGLVRARMT